MQEIHLVKVGQLSDKRQPQGKIDRGKSERREIRRPAGFYGVRDCIGESKLIRETRHLTCPELVREVGNVFQWLRRTV
jgi:hypothetical protein